MIKSGLFEAIKNAKVPNYLQNRDVGLLEKMRSRAKLKVAPEKSNAGLEVDDEELLHELKKIGFNRETVKLLYLVPLIQIAWSEGTVTSPELRKILEIARSNETLTKKEFNHLLNWINNKPSEEFFATSLNVISLILESLSEEEKVESTKNLLSYCTAVARASDGFFARQDKMAEIKATQIKEIIAALENPTK